MVSIVYRPPTWRWFNDEPLCDDATFLVHYLVYLHGEICITIINLNAYTSAKWYSFNTRTCSRSLCLFTIIEQPIVSKIIYTWKKYCNTLIFFSWQNCATQVFSYWWTFTENSTGKLQIESLAHRETHFTFKNWNLMLYNS